LKINFYFAITIVGTLLFAYHIDAFDFSDFDKKAISDYQVPGATQGNLVPASNGLGDGDNSLDPGHYYIGGGDVFFISAVGSPTIQYTATINQQCDLYIPALGVLKLGKITLFAAQKRIGEFVQTKLKKQNEMYVVLTKAKKVTISVNGAVANPGTYTFPGSYRILDALRAANNGALPSMSGCNFREVQCSNKDSAMVIDLFTYLLKNDIAGNPYLYPGDRITIPYATKSILMNGPIKSIVTGWIPIKENESLSSLLSLFTFDASADTSRIFFQTTVSDSIRSTRTIGWNEAVSITLHDRDIITVLQKNKYKPVLLITVSGEVAQPGMYPIIRDSTTVDIVLAMAGGPTQFADVSRAVIIRRDKIADEQTTNEPNVSTNAVSMRPEMSAGFLKMNTMNDYSIVNLKNRGMAVKLIANDEIFFPHKDIYVYISGNIKNPGAYEYVPGKSYDYYIAKAGGYTRIADKSNMFGVRRYSVVSQKTDLTEIIAGDVIVIPDSQQHKFLINILLPVLQTTATIISVLLALYTVNHH
jgi:polysaccharide export outer membrane protein